MHVLLAPSLALSPTNKARTRVHDNEGNGLAFSRHTLSAAAADAHTEGLLLSLVNQRENQR